jgi:hypothetical protein
MPPSAVCSVDVDGVLCRALVDDGVRRFDVCVRASGLGRKNGGTTV